MRTKKENIITCSECGKTKHVRFAKQLTCSRECFRARRKRIEKMYRDMKKGVRLGTGSVSRSFNYQKKYQNNPEFRKKVNEYSRKKYWKKKEKDNNRCVDCNKLISENATRCKACSIQNNYNKFYRNRLTRKSK